MLYASFILLSWLLIGRSHTQDCDISTPTIELPIGNGTIGGDPESVRWGLSLGVGTPPQQVVAAINPDWNNSWLWGSQRECTGKISEDNCIWFRGGVFNEAESSSWVPTEIPDVYDFRASGNQRLINSPWGNETITLKPDTTVGSVPLYSPKTGQPPQGSIGLGRASSFLDVLKAQKKIASRTWSLFWGWQGLEASYQMKGNLVLGGYDRAKTKGDSFTKDFVDAKECTSELMVYVKEIYITTWFGEKKNIFESLGSTLNACIRPDFPPISLPDPIFQNFKGSLPGKYLGPANGIYDDSIVHGSSEKDMFRGNLTFTLDSGLGITVPNHQLVLPNVVINRDGHQTFANDSRIIPVRNAGRRGISLGQAFLSSAYIHVNNDLKNFSIWQANPTEETDIVGVAEGSCDSDPSIGSPSENSANKMSGGTIAGIVIGVVAGIALIGVSVWFIIWRKRKRDQDARISQAHSQVLETSESKHRVPELDDTGSSNPASRVAASKFDLGSTGQQDVNEMPTSPQPQQPPIELPGDHVRRTGEPV
ncbi:hypothetical protein AJ78_07609 [Emergomyces pasteurianus Ep9510]|uniref:Peptidase A1 domain-containing protein n=1 Tax=Emergomyces pasteurianus Ep9510 TaxID=1447872 RepID=A0A1J9P4N0_9EURO|nr:hypothetical protein AJ78_07609 [Emergomyces pasteurianus Ep9510]